MKVRIEDIIVKDRIRKKYGRIDELADDIRENGIISPPVVTPDLELIAGERRLRALQMIGYEEVEVRIMEVRDYEHMFNLEISENESRLEFSKRERIDYARQLEEIERMKARERQGQRTDIKEKFPESEDGQTRDLVAAKIGIGSGRQYDKEKYIVDNADDETLDAWDKGDISTHKAYMKLKEEKEPAERRAQEAERALQEERSKPPEVVEKVIEQKVERIPKDYIQVKDYARGLEEKMLKLRHQIDDLLAEKKSLENKAQESEITKKRSDEYQDLQRKIRDLAGQSNEMEKRLDAIGDISDFKRHVENMIQNELAPVKYTRAFREIQNESIILDNIKELLGRVTAWVAEITAIVEKAESSMYPYEEYKAYEEDEYERIDD